MENNKAYKNINELASDLKLLVEKIELGNAQLEDFENALNTSVELNERLAILKYKAVEKLVKGDDVDESRNRFKLNLKKTNQLSLEEVISDTVKEKLEKAQTNFLDEIIHESPVEKPTNTTPVKEEPKTPSEPVQKSADQQEESVNERFSKSSKTTLGDKLNHLPIKNLKDSIGINMKFLFMNDLFHGENAHYNESLDKLNTFNNHQEALAYIDTLKSKYNWEEEHPSVESFLELIERRYL